MLHNPNRLESVLKSLEAEARTSSNSKSRLEDAGETIRFITISRQAGAGGITLASQLALAIHRLNPDDTPWCVWDKELVEKVSREHHIPDKYIGQLEDESHPWFSEFLDSLAGTDHPSDLKVYRRVAMAVRALAHAGNAIIVGRGGVFITEGMPGGLHIRLVAPVDVRIRQLAKRLNIPLDEATVKVHDTDRNRTSFYRRYRPTKDVSRETFALTLNTAELTDAQMVASLVPLISRELVELNSAVNPGRGHKGVISPFDRFPLLTARRVG